MSRCLTVSELLNATNSEPSTALFHTPKDRLVLPQALVDVRQQFVTLADLLNASTRPLYAPPVVAEWFLGVIEGMNAGATPTTPMTAQLSLSPVRTASVSAPWSSLLPSRFSIACFPSEPVSDVQTLVKLSRKTTLSQLYRYEDVHTFIEYPNTSVDQPTGHLFRRDPENWQDPACNFAYSLGLPSGWTRKGAEVTCPLLYETGDAMKLVPCTESHFTCM